MRRIRPGETLTVSDGAGVLADCVVESADKRTLTARVLQRRTVSSPHPAVTVVQAIPKSERSELAVELATEAGADEFVAWQAARCVARWDGDRAEKGLRRWRAVARSAAGSPAARTSGGVRADVHRGADRRYLADRVAAGALALVLHESADPAAGRPAGRRV